jgi:RAD54-like protein 2
VIELSSDDEDDDDVTVLETPEEEIEADDPNNSGLHVDDTLNIPDENGRVLVNVGHPGDELDVFLPPQIAKVIKPHQVCSFLGFYCHWWQHCTRGPGQYYLF